MLVGSYIVLLMILIDKVRFKMLMLLNVELISS